MLLSALAYMRPSLWIHVTRRTLSSDCLTYSSSPDDISALRSRIFDSEDASWHPSYVELHNVMTMCERSDWLAARASFIQHGQQVAIVIRNPNSLAIHLSPTPDHRVSDGNRGEVRDALVSMLAALEPLLSQTKRLAIRSYGACKDVILAELPTFTMTFDEPSGKLYVPKGGTSTFYENGLPECPPGFYFDSIDVESEAQLVHDAWALRALHGPDVVRHQLQHLPHAAIRTRLENKLVAWEMSNSHLQLSNQHTLRPYRSSGLGSIAARALMVKYFEINLRVNAHVTHENKKGVLWGELGYMDWHRDATTGEPYVYHATLFERQ